MLLKIEECSSTILGVPFKTDEEKLSFINLWSEIKQNRMVTELFTIGNDDNNDDQDKNKDEDKDEENQDEGKNNEGQD